MVGEQRVLEGLRRVKMELMKFSGMLFEVEVTAETFATYLGNIYKGNVNLEKVRLDHK